MRDDEKLEITAGQIRKLAEKYETGSCNLYEVFPEVFDERWELVDNRDIESKVCSDGCGGFNLEIVHDGYHVVKIWANGCFGTINSDYRIDSDRDTFRLYCKVS